MIFIQDGWVIILIIGDVTRECVCLIIGIWIRFACVLFWFIVIRCFFLGSISICFFISNGLVFVATCSLFYSTTPTSPSLVIVSAYSSPSMHVDNYSRSTLMSSWYYSSPSPTTPSYFNIPNISLLSYTSNPSRPSPLCL